MSVGVRLRRKLSLFFINCITYAGGGFI